jgi:DNA repair protein RecO (recombination protein O)
VTSPRPLPIHVPAIVVGTTTFREADTIVRLLTPDHGRITAVARNARRSTRRFGGALDVGNRIDATLRVPKRGMWGMDEAALIDGRHRTRTDLGRMGMVAYACEVAGRLAREEHGEPKLFGLLDMACTLLDATSEPPAAGFRIGLEAKALTFAGLAPVLDRCAGCGSPPDEPMVLDPHTGVAHHAGCAVVGGVPVSIPWLQAVELTRRSPLRSSLDTALPPGPSWAMAEVIEAHLGSALKSRRVLSSLLSVDGPSTDR